jgi:OPA family glycerol-3-phosphate transporter-like MFS transporter
MGVISLSYLFGDAAARWFMGLLMEAGLGWREVFVGAAGVLFLLTSANALWLKETPRDIGHEEPAANPLNVYHDASPDQGRAESLAKLLLPLLSSPEFIVVCLLSLGLTLLRETFNLWTPAYFSEVLGLSRSQAAAQSAWFPLLGGASVLLAGWGGDRLGVAGRALVILAGCAAAAGVMWALAALDVSAGRMMPIALVATLGFCILGPYSYLAGAISLDLGGKRGAATACGIIDGVGYLGAVMAGDTVARLSEAYGWSGTFQALAAVAALTSCAAAVFVVIQRRKVPA